MKIVTVSMAKGGCGKTTVSTAMAVCAGQAGQRVLFVDLDSQAHGTIHLGARPVDGVRDFIVGGRSLTGLVERVRDNVYLLPGGASTRGVDAYCQAVNMPVMGLRDLIQDQADGFDLVVLDTSAHALLNEMAIAAADAILAPVPMRQIDLDGLVSLANYLAAIYTGRLSGSRVPSVFVVPNRYDGRTRQSADTLADLEQVIQVVRARGDIFENWRITRPIRENVAVDRSYALGQSVVEAHPSAPAAQDLEAMAVTVLALLEDNGDVPAQFAEVLMGVEWEVDGE